MASDPRHETAAAALLGVAAVAAERQQSSGPEQRQQQQASAQVQGQQAAPATTRLSGPATAALNQAQEAQTLSMSSIGFGIDSSNTAKWGDGTDAAIRALQDSMERSTLRLPMISSSHSLQIKVQIGVPPKQPGSAEPMLVDVSRVTAVLPPSIPVQPIQVVVGGLYLPGSGQEAPSICTATACVTLESHTPTMMGQYSTEQANESVNPWSGLARAVAAEAAAAAASANVPLPASAMGMPRDIPTQSFPFVSTQELVAAQAALNAAASSAAVARQPPRRNSSIEMLAMIGSEMHSSTTPQNSNQKQSEKADTNRGISSPQHSVEEGESMSGGEYDPNSANYNYKKLPPGTTTKNNKRLFVKHKYRDYSHEPPLPEEHDLVVGPSAAPAARTANAAFPLKLHETLAQIEEDGYSNIVGWMTHGRSFRIHNQKEFSEIILPKYFVMTKKSSFLRQLNLYGFNRFSAGYDQGAYYHEKFLRGLKFLCRRMTRQKVNGNRIRSAGNPDEEPDLSSYPSCPPPNGLVVGAGSGGAPPSPQRYAGAAKAAGSKPSSIPPKQRFKYRTSSEDDPNANRIGNETESSEEGQDETQSAGGTGLQVSVPL